jgi:uncharacterized protein YggU (UPF0235/DUF167 family)
VAVSRAEGSSVRLAVRLTPRGGIDRIEAFDPGGALRVRVRAAPAEGAANEALLRLLADVLGVPKDSVRLVAGARARQKVVEVEGLTVDQLHARLASSGAGQGIDHARRVDG